MKLMGKEVNLRSLTVHFIAFFLYFLSNTIYIVFALLVTSKEAELRGDSDWSKHKASDLTSQEGLINEKTIAYIFSDLVFALAQIILALILMKLQSLVHNRRHQKMRA